MHEKIVKEINKIREERGLTIEELAEEAGIFYPYLKGLLEGKRKTISLRAIGKIAEAFKIEPKELIKK